MEATSRIMEATSRIIGVSCSVEETQQCFIAGFAIIALKTVGGFADTQKNPPPFRVGKSRISLPHRSRNGSISLAPLCFLGLDDVIFLQRLNRTQFVKCRMVHTRYFHCLIRLHSIGGVADTCWPHFEPSPRSSLNSRRSRGVEITGISRIPACINTGTICFDTARISGYRQVPKPPARITPFRVLFSTPVLRSITGLLRAHTVVQAAQAIPQSLIEFRRQCQCRQQFRNLSRLQHPAGEPAEYPLQSQPLFSSSDGPP